ncbi:MAG: MoxR family ATPase [Actinobacteria bacterium]|nr:MoxR family ATPase [Actinomycetota bacterium]
MITPDSPAPSSSADYSAVIGQIEQSIVGKRAIIELLLDAVAARGHVLLDDVPGVAKTLLAKSFADASGLIFSRIQFTPDLMPADVTGASIWNPAEHTIEFHPGPVFANVVLADEINRAPAKTQSALLEAMAEGQVTVDGTTHRLPDPFVVIATQNPIDQDGTYSLPEAQLDRFLISTSMGYPERDDEAEVVRRHLIRNRSEAASDQADHARHTVDREGVVGRMRAAASAVAVHDAVIDYAVRIVDESRHDPGVRLGASPRASIGLVAMAQAKAARQGRDHILPDDLKAAAAAVLGHRLILTSELWIDGVQPERVVESILTRVAAPTPNDLL